MARGARQPDETAKMTSEACDIAVSEMTGVPRELICGWILVTVDHTVPGSHRSSVIQGWPANDEWVARWLETVAADVREDLGR